MNHGAHNATNPLDNPLWQYALKQYAAPGCAEFLLAAQDQHDLDINVLLYLGWLSKQKRIFNADTLKHQQYQKWQDLICPLRQLRRDSKEVVNEALYQSLKDTELLAEQSILAWLYELTSGNTEYSGSSEACLEKNLELYLLESLMTQPDWKQRLTKHLLTES